jgi:hypothetical protein
VTGAAADASTGQFPPVYVDRYPALKTYPSPILYLRAHTGVVGTAASPQICTSDSAGLPAQYDNAELMPYSALFPELATCGAGGKPPANRTTGKQDYATWAAYFADPNTVNITNGATVPIPGVTPAARHADTYLLISPGLDGQYGTIDDLSN